MYLLGVHCAYKYKLLSTVSIVSDVYVVPFPSFQPKNVQPVNDGVGNVPSFCPNVIVLLLVLSHTLFDATDGLFE